MGGHRDEEVAASPLLPVPTQAAGGRRRGHAADVHILSAAFLFVFSAYSAAQNLESTVNTEGDLGTVSLGILYISFTLFSVVASPVVTRLGSKRALVVGTSGYVLFILANLVPSWYTMVPASLYLGFCASIIWVGQGTYLTSAALSHARDNNLSEGPTLGKFTGEFWGIFASTQVLGNLLSLALLRNGKDGGSLMGENLLFVVFLGSMIVGIVFMCFLSKRDEKGNNDPVHSSFGAMLKYIIAPLKDQRILLIIPLMVYIGLQNAFVWAVSTKSIVKPVLGISGVGGAMAIYGAAAAICALVTGCLTSGLYSATFIVSIGAVVQAVVLFWLLLFYSPTVGVLGAAAPLLIGALWGVGEGMLNTVLNTVLGLLFEDAKCLQQILKFRDVANAGGCLCTVKGLGMCCRCRHLLLEPKHHTTGHAHPDDHRPLHLMWSIPVPDNCHRKAIDRQILRQVYILASFWSVLSAAWSPPHIVFTADMRGKCPSCQM